MTAGLVRSCATTGAVSLSRFSSCSEHASVQTTEHYHGCKQNLGHPVNDLFDLRTDAEQPAKAEECVPAKGASGVVENAHETGLKCRHRGSEHEQPIPPCHSERPSESSRFAVVEVRKGHPPQSLRRCSETRASQGNSGNR